MSFNFILRDKNFDFQMAHYESSQAQKILLQMRKDGGFSDVKLKASDDEIISAHKVKLDNLKLSLPGLIYRLNFININNLYITRGLSGVF